MTRKTTLFLVVALGMASAQTAFMSISAAAMRALASATLSWTAWLAFTGTPVLVAMRLRASPTVNS